jgi:pectinesterase
MNKYKLLILLPFIISTKLLFAGQYDIIVAKDGTGNFKTVQEAFNSIPDNNKVHKTILIRRGIYYEKVTLAKGKNNLTIIGEDRDGTILTYNDFKGKVVNGDTINTPTTQSVAIDADDIELINITFRNTTGIIGFYSQAVAIRVNGDRIFFSNCCFIGCQDTYFTAGGGRIYHKNCYIEGTTDFIFGNSIAVFDSCIIKSKKNSHITAAGTDSLYKFGYIFRNCTLIADDTIKGSSLGRPWRPNAKVVYLNCKEGKHIRPEGWSVWNKNNNHLNSFFAEYKCSGEGYNPATRLTWTHQLTEQQAAEYTIENIFSKTSGYPAFSNDWIPGR